jgi:uncharacterized membrane protein YbjE (DUF340 family)
MLRGELSQMPVMNNKKFLLLLHVLPLVIPVNIYAIGNGFGEGIQWALFKYQRVVYQGVTRSSLITVSNDIGYVLSGILTGRSGLSVIIWCAGALMLTLALLIFILSAYFVPGSGCNRKNPYLVIIAGVLFVVSCMLQYGYLLNGVAGFSVPVGVPLIVGLGWWLYRQKELLEPADDAE